MRVQSKMRTITDLHRLTVCLMNWQMTTLTTSQSSIIAPTIQNYYINLNDREYLDVLSSLMNKRNKLIQSGKYLRNEIRKVNIDDDSLQAAKLKISAISERLSELRKDVRLCDAIAERSGVMQENLEKVLAEEEKTKGKENRSYVQQR